MNLFCTNGINKQRIKVQWKLRRMLCILITASIWPKNSKSIHCFMSVYLGFKPNLNDVLVTIICRILIQVFGKKVLNFCQYFGSQQLFIGVIYCLFQTKTVKLRFFGRIVYWTLLVNTRSHQSCQKGFTWKIGKVLLQNIKK